MMWVLAVLALVLCLHQASAFVAAGPRGAGVGAGLRLGRGAALTMNNAEVTFVMVKPDGLERGLVGRIIDRFESKGFQLKALKLMKPPKAQVEEHYRDLASKPFFPKVVTYMTSGPVVGMVWQGKNVVKTGRVMLGATNPADSAPGTIRGDFALDVGRNVIHGSDSVESAEREIKLWFGADGLVDWTQHSKDWIYE